MTGQLLRGAGLAGNLALSLRPTIRPPKSDATLSSHNASAIKPTIAQSWSRTCFVPTYIQNGYRARIRTITLIMLRQDGCQQILICKLWMMFMGTVWDNVSFTQGRHGILREQKRQLVYMRKKSFSVVGVDIYWLRGGVTLHGKAYTSYVPMQADKYLESWLARLTIRSRQFNLASLARDQCGYISGKFRK